MGNNRNFYAAEIKTGPGTRVTVTIECDNTSHARQLLEMQYGCGNVINLRQIPSGTPVAVGHRINRKELS